MYFLHISSTVLTVASMEALLVSYGRIVEGPRRSISHMSNKDAGKQVKYILVL